MLPNVTILVPAYKDRFFKIALKSMLDQTYGNLRILVLDDASPYNLKQIVDSFQSDKISYYRNGTNVGMNNLTANWNKILSLADTELVVLGSDDDLYHPEYVRTLVDLSLKYPAVDVFHCRVGVIDEAGKLVHLGSSAAEYETDIDFIYQRAVNRRTQLISDFMIRRPALDHIGGFADYPQAWYSDEMTLYRLSKGKGVVCSPETLFYWRTSGDNISSSHTDTMRKAKASVKHLENMSLFLNTLVPASEQDEFLLNALKQRVGKEIRRQLIYDMAKSSARLNWEIMRTYPSLLSRKEKLLLATLYLRKHVRL